TIQLAAAFGTDSVLMLNPANGQSASEKAEPLTPTDNSIFQRLWFSQDGKSIVVLETIEDRNYLRHSRLKLTVDETKALGKENAVGRTLPKAQIPLRHFDALRGGLGKDMSTDEVAKWFSDSVVVVG